MEPKRRRMRREYALIQLLPNFVTIAAVCAGLTAIRFTFQGNYELAVQLIVLATVLDGMDGRLARFFGSDSKMGAELDSLADFLNFGIAPPLVLYVWALQDTGGLGWMAVLVFAVCAVMRLARFNVTAKSDEEMPAHRSDYFTGVPAPAGGLLVMLPLYVSFAFNDMKLLPDVLLCVYMAGIGLLLISTIPTRSFKALKVSRENVRYILLAFALAGVAVLTYAWATLILACLAYVALVLWGLLPRNRPKQDL
ncbi:MAG: phosphatidylcholine/phosphatidylserine synthase [Rhodobacteraceae bacterium]|nr:MAG: phosphatidylcholine/phosphatidylserine synthase [Paracoccaceae bacterium]